MVGVNGSGKTTLLAACWPALIGARRGGPEARSGHGARRCALGYLPQEDTELDPALRALEAVAEVRGTVDSASGELSAEAAAGALGLRGDTQWTPVGELSGGERRRLQLLRLLMAEPNVLLLDEPTNDLDIDTLTELEDLLDGWPGSLVVVSHDRYFLERVTDHVLALLGDGKLGVPARRGGRVPGAPPRRRGRRRRGRPGPPGGDHRDRDRAATRFGRHPARRAQGNAAARTAARAANDPGSRTDRGTGRQRQRLRPADRAG